MERSSAMLGQSPPVCVIQPDERHKRQAVMNSPLYISGHFYFEPKLPVVSFFSFPSKEILLDVMS